MLSLVEAFPAPFSFGPFPPASQLPLSLSLSAFSATVGLFWFFFGLFLFRFPYIFLRLFLLRARSLFVPSCSPRNRDPSPFTRLH